VTNVSVCAGHKLPINVHSGSKIEGELRLDEKEYIFKGGKMVQLYLPGKSFPKRIDSAGFPFQETIKDVMPSKGKLLSKKKSDCLTPFGLKKVALWPEGVAYNNHS